MKGNKMKRQSIHIFIGFMALLIFSCAPQPYGTTSTSSPTYVNFEQPAPNYFEGSKKYIPNEQSNPNLDFYDFIKGVKHANIIINKDFQNSIDNGDETALKLGTIYRKYLHNLGFNYVALTTDEKDELFKVESLCDLATFSFYFNSSNNFIKDILFDIRSCNGDVYRFTSTKSYRDGRNWENNYYSVLTSLFWHNIPRNDEFRQKLPAQMTDWEEEKLKIHLDENGSIGIEGIYEKMKLGKSEWTEAKYKIGVVKTKDGFDAIYIDGANNHLDWTEGELKANIIKTATPNLYKVDWLMAGKQKNEDVYCFIDDNNLLTFQYSTSEKDPDSKYLKLYPTASTYEVSSSGNFLASGTGFAISSNGLIITNHHVIENAKVIKVEVTQVGLKKTYDAEVILSDQRNDLAVLQITDDSFSSFNDIPFTFKKDVSDMGTNVFTLGYPLISTMGESIKLTDGLISSKMGFQGDISSYQLSVPIHPGNSGGPLFDYDGNLIGVVNAKHLGAENATYAIKSNYLVNLMELLPNPPELPKKNTLKNSSLSEQVKTIENFVFLIKVK